MTQIAPPIFVISIDLENGARRQNSLLQFNSINSPFTFVDGVKTDDPALADIYSRWRNLLWMKRNLSAGEIAVYASHRKAWAMFLATDEPVALIAEDDLAILDQDLFSKAVAAAQGERCWDILKFFDFNPKPVVTSQIWDGMTVVDYKYPASGAVAYLITKDAAHRLLSRTKIFRPVDEDFSHAWEFDVHVRSVFPNIVDEISLDLGGSTIEGPRKSSKRNNSRLRSFWGVFLQMKKQINARIYLRRTRRKFRNI